MVIVVFCRVVAPLDIHLSGCRAYVSDTKGLGRIHDDGGAGMAGGDSSARRYHWPADVHAYGGAVLVCLSGGLAGGRHVGLLGGETDNGHNL